MTTTRTPRRRWGAVALAVVLLAPSACDAPSSGSSSSGAESSVGTTDVPLQWSGERNGEYRGVFAAADEGLYAVRVEANRGTASLGTGVTHLRAAPGDSEYFDAGMNAARLKRIADETGGRFYKAAEAAALAEDVRYSGRGVTTTEERDLWHMPIVLGLILGLMCGEWGYRRAVGLA